MVAKKLWPVGVGSASSTGIGFRWRKSSGAVGIGFAGGALVGWQLGSAASLCGKRPLFGKRCPEQWDGHADWGKVVVAASDSHQLDSAVGSPEQWCWTRLEQQCWTRR